MTPNSAVINYNIFLQAGPPSAPGAPSFTAIGSQIPTTNGINLSATTTAPQFADGVNFTNSPPSIANYKISLYTSGDSSYRYNGPVTQTYNNTSTTVNIQLSGLYPDCVYTGNCQANNNSSNNAYGTISSNSGFTTTNLTMPTITGTYTYNPTVISAKLIGPNTDGDTADATKSVIFTNPGTLNSTGYITSSIHTVSSRGNSTTPNLLTIQGNIYRGGSLIETVSLNYGGFSKPTPSSVGTNIIINPTAPVDGYSGTGLTGYYLKAATSFSLTSNAFVASNNKTYANVIIKQTSTDGAMNPYSYSYYYDYYSGSPTITSVNILLTSASTIRVSGIYLITGVAGSFTFSGNTIVNNIGVNYYNNTQILQYSTGQKEQGTTNITVGKLPTSFSSTVDFSNNGLSPQSNITTFGNTYSLSVTAYGPTNTTSSPVTSNQINMIIDYPTYSLINSSNYPTSVPTIGTSSALECCRIASLTAVTLGTSSYVTTLPPSQVNATTYVYDQTQSILPSNTNYGQDLQISNGYYQTYGPSVNSSNGYLNYNSYLYGFNINNTLDYSTISNTGYRYATFAFQVATSSSQYTGITFTLNNVAQTVNLTNKSAPIIGSSRLYFYYRVEDATNYSSFSSSYRNTTWIDAVNVGGTTVNSSNYYQISSTPLSGGNTSSFTNNIYTIGSICNALTVNSGDSIYVYFRVCAPMSENFWFSYVTAQMS